ncbi:nitroreductase [Planctomycetales bacterium]|nr:nitroreductase [Planctomycetales bacterium]
MKNISLDKYLCVKCGQCVAVCPSHIFRRTTPNVYPVCTDYASEVCISCNHCQAVCPVGAIKVDGIGTDDCLSMSRDSVPRFEHIENLARARRSIRCYTDAAVEDKEIESLLDIVRYAPSARNGLPVKWIAVNNRKKVKELAGYVATWAETQLNSELLLAEWKSGNDPFFRGAPCVLAAYTNETAMWPVVDASIAVATLDLCATAKRLGSCWAGYFVRAAQSETDKAKINGWLGLKSDETVQGALMLGHCGEVTYQRIPYRPEAELRWIR